MHMESESAHHVYRQAHFSDKGGYGPLTSTLCRTEAPFFDMEIDLAFQKIFRLLKWTPEDLQDKRFTEIGAGWGNRLNQLTGFGIPAANLSGVDLHEEFVEAGALFNPGIRLRKGSAKSLAVPDSSVDLAFASMAFSAMSEDSTILACLGEMRRISREAIVILDCFDPSVVQSRNGAVFYRGISRTVSESIFLETPDWKAESVREFWTFSPTSWRLFNLLRKLGHPLAGYAVFRISTRHHSHRAVLLTRKFR